MRDWEKIELLFHQALEYPNEERGEFLAQADTQLRGELQALLDAHEENRSFMETPVVRVSLSPQFDRWQAQIVESLVPPSQPAGQMSGACSMGNTVSKSCAVAAGWAPSTARCTPGRGAGWPSK
jgi:hypothetical protein